MKELLQEIQLPAYEFVDNPSPMDRVDYDDTLSRLLQQTSRFAGLISIYSLHRDIYPGLSKIRLCYVLNDLVDESALRKGLFPTIRKLIQGSTIIEAPQFITQSVFQHIDQVMPQSNLHNEYGQETRFAVLTGEDRNFAYILALNERILMSPLLELFPMLINGTIRVLDGWKYIESVIGLIYDYQKATGKISADWHEYIKKSHELARNWFSMNLGRYQEIKQLIRESVLILFSIINEFYNYLKHEKLFFVQDGVMTAGGKPVIVSTTEYRASFFTDLLRVLYIDDWSIEKSFYKMVTLCRQNKPLCLYLPTLLSVPFTLYIRGLEFHSILVQKSLLMHGYSGNVSMPGVVDVRNRWLSQYLNFSLIHRDWIDHPVWLGYRLEKTSKWAKWLENRRKAQHEKWQHNISLELARI